MKSIIIISDSHGYGKRLTDIIDKNLKCGSKVDEVIFLGDGIRDILDFIPKDCSLYAVRGNCDFGTFLFSGDIIDNRGNNIPDERLEIIEGKRILMMHGHKYFVKNSLDMAIEKAFELDADILLFGHTHSPIYFQILKGNDFLGSKAKKDLHIFNPGALCESSFGILTIQKENIILSHGTI